MPGAPAPSVRRPWGVQVSAATLVAALALSACTPAGRAGESAADRFVPEAASPSSTAGVGGSLRIGLSNDPMALDPRLLVDPEGEEVVDAVFDSLTRLDSSLAVRPEAAARWVTDDARTWTFTLRQDTFHNGDSVDATAFKRAFDRIADGTADPPSPVAGLLRRVDGFEASQRDGAPLAGVEVVDDMTLRIRLVEPFAELPLLLSDPALAPVPALADADPLAFASQPVGNGPFEVAAERRPGQFIRLRGNADHPRPPRLDEIVFQIYADDPSMAQQFADFEAGQLDVAAVPPGELRYARRTYGLSPDGYTGPGVLDGESAALYYLGFNTTVPPFDDPAVRRAVSLLLDRDRLAREVFHGTRTAADALTPPALPGHVPGTCAWCRYAPDEARALVQAREAPIPGPLRLVYNTGRVHQAVAREVADRIEQVLGVDVELRANDLDTYVDRLDAGDMQIFRLGWEAPYPSASALLEPLFRSDPPGPDNHTRYANPRVDELLRRARAETSDALRRELLTEAERVVLDDAAVAPVAFYRHALVVADRVVGLRVNAMGGVDLASVSMNDEA